MSVDCMLCAHGLFVPRCAGAYGILMHVMVATRCVLDVRIHIKASGSATNRDSNPNQVILTRSLMHTRICVR